MTAADPLVDRFHGIAGDGMYVRSGKHVGFILQNFCIVHGQILQKLRINVRESFDGSFGFIALVVPAMYGLINLRPGFPLTKIGFHVFFANLVTPCFFAGVDTWHLPALKQKERSLFADAAELIKLLFRYYFRNLSPVDFLHHDTPHS